MSKDLTRVVPLFDKPWNQHHHLWQMSRILLFAIFANGKNATLTIANGLIGSEMACSKPMSKDLTGVVPIDKPWQQYHHLWRMP